MQPILEHGSFYHIYNRANGNEVLFKSKSNYLYFLEKYTHYINPIADTYAYCLLPNHFHFLIKIKEKEFIQRPNRFLKPVRFSLSKPFSDFFNAYAKAFNREQNRSGKLFQLPFKRVEVTDDDYFTIIISYIHRNPLHYKITKNFEDYPFSSYRAILSDKPTALERKYVLEWFGGRKVFMKFHKEEINMYLKEQFLLE